MKSLLKIILGSCLGLFLGIIALIAIGSLVGGIFASKFTGEQTIIKSNSILKLDFSNVLPDKTNNVASDPLSFENETYVGLIDALRLIKHAKEDNNIKAIYINPGQTVNAGSAGLKQIHDALLDFKNSGKMIYAYGENLSQGGYYISSVADKIFLNPMGDLSFKGLATGLMYFKNLIEKLNLKIQIFYVGKFKSATEPFRSDKMSDENRTQMKIFLNGLFNQTIEDISNNRKLDPVQVREIASKLLIRSPEDALKYRFVDHIAYEDEVYDDLREYLSIDKKEKLNFVSLSSYYDAVTLSKDFSIKDKIAIVYAEGEINDSNNHDGEIGGKAYVQYLRKIRLDDNIKAVVLRINSPGGSAYASEQMWREIELIKAAGKKVVVSMGDYAASGGYYIACNADSIFASPNTITGSIGVFGILGNISGFLNQHAHINLDSVKTDPNAFGMNLYFELTNDEKAAIQKGVEQVYDIFIDRVAKGRNLSKSTVDSIAQGRIYSGKDAIEIKLVDRLGNLEDAINAASKLSKVEKYRLVEYPETKPQLEKLMDKITGKEDDEQVVVKAIKKEINTILPGYMDVHTILSNNKIQARIPFIIKHY